MRDELAELGLTANALSKALGVPVNRITMILNGQRGVSADTALRLARYFGTTPEMWLNLQKTWELRQAEFSAGSEVATRVTPRLPAAVGAAMMAATSFKMDGSMAFLPTERRRAAGLVRKLNTRVITF